MGALKSVEDILVGAQIGWYQSWRRSGMCSGGKRLLTWDHHLLDIFGPKLTSVGEVWLGPVSIHDICSGLTLGEDVNSPNQGPGKGYNLVTI